MRSFLLVAYGALLSGCALLDSQKALQAQNDMVGLTRGDLLACAGAPVSTIRDGELEVMRYEVNFPGDGLACTTNVTLREGAVANVSYSGPTSGGLLTPAQACAATVARCARKPS